MFFFLIKLQYFLYLKLQTSPKDTQNFCEKFTRMKAVLTLEQKDAIRCIDQDAFAEFSFVNHNLKKSTEKVFAYAE